MSQTAPLTKQTESNNSGVEFYPANIDPRDDVANHSLKVIVIGAGPAGIRFAHELLKRQPKASIQIFGNEPYRPYNRVQLSALLAGDIEYEEIHTKIPNDEQHPGFKLHINAIQSIDTTEQVAVDQHGHEHSYSHLVIATGARPHQPNIPGYEQAGVYTFRNLKDTEHLFSRVNRARHIVVVGGGLLGLEAARALLRHNTKVTLIQQGARLMNRQLDNAGAARLQKKVEALGIHVITNSGVRQILGEGRVTGVVTRDKEQVECDTVLICAGIKPNMEMARTAKLRVARGIVVDDHLQTSAKNVFAIGECSEHRGETYGLVNPGYEQAAICADVISGGSAHYVGSFAVSRLKVVGEQVCSMGEVAEIHKRPKLSEISYNNPRKNIYRKLTVYKGRLIGALAYGEWSQLTRVQEAFQSHRRLWPWQLLWFKATGDIFFGEGGKDNINNWPLTSVVCQCNNINLEALIEARDGGKHTVKQLQDATGAGTVCGSCKPLLEQITEDNGPREKEKTWLPTLLISLLAITVTTLISVMPSLSVSDSVQTVNSLEKIWNDKFYKQVTGFTLLGLSAIGLLMSLRKKMAKKPLGNFAYWRLFHIVIGLVCTFTLILHTGLHFGENLNRILMIDFVAIIFVGALAGGIIALSHTLKSTSAIRLRRFWQWTHILVTWPLPMLLAAHILTVYYF